MLRGCLGLLSAALLFGCGADPDEPTAPETASSFCAQGTPSFTPNDASLLAAPIAETEIAGSSCGAIERQYTPPDSPHLPDCSRVTYNSDPPCGGPHYGTWAAYQSYSEPVPRGFLVHSLEHGAVVFFYSCSDCADEVAQAQAVIDALPEDPVCVPQGVARRTILTPDPLLGSRWAAAAWGFTLNADCFDAAAFDAFARAHYATSPENLCGGGFAGAP